MSSKLLWRTLIFIAICFMLFSLGKNLYQNWKINQEVDKLTSEISDIKQTNLEESEKLLYYQGASYKERIARERFGLQKPGEEVVVIIPEEKPKEVEEQPKVETTNVNKWWNYFFGIDK